MRGRKKFLKVFLRVGKIFFYFQGFAAMTERFIRRQMDPVELARPSNLIVHLFDLLIPPEQKNNFSEDEKKEKQIEKNMELSRNSAFISAVLALFANLCKASPTVTAEILQFVFFLILTVVRLGDFGGWYFNSFFLVTLLF